MRIRAITIGSLIPFLYNTLSSFMEEKLETFNHLNEDLIERFHDLDIEVQSRRLCSQPLFSYEEKSFYKKNLQETLKELGTQFEILLNLIQNYHIDYLASCSMLAYEFENFGPFEKLFLEEVPHFLQKYENLFTSLPVASTYDGINFSALKSGAKIIKRLSSPEPFDNLKFCISSNVLPNTNTPFFPASYHFADNPSFSIAIEMADEVVKVFEAAKNINDARDLLKRRFNKIYDQLIPICTEVSKNHNIHFNGLDFSPAPFPKYERSIGTAIEKLGIDYFGAPGSLLGVSIITDSIPYEKQKVIGFSGFMQPIFEDYTLAKRLKEDRYSLDTLLLYSTMCGTGLDCVPLPGNITERELFYILLDMCTISVKLNKPLTARLMPIPNKGPGDEVEFDFEYFAPSKVMDIRRLKEGQKNDLFSSNEKSFNF
ncbi:MAG: hypothetical protein BAJALOKI2v1_50036 [Promethearchaeota archaeon]|nr:MAG: hypothetical protein BAJALOKI2v1_50036 [Candidatus Lokiarchaeota archaeon]